jgi:hypothetical protein
MQEKKAIEDEEVKDDKMIAAKSKWDNSNWT